MIAVIDVVGKNLASIANALDRLHVAYTFTHCPEQILKAKQVILPGVGTAKEGMKALRQQGLVEILQQLTQPLIGICIGMQLLFEYSEEDQVTCLGLIPGQVRRLHPQDNLPVPHMGWNQLQWRKPSSLREGISDADFVYFVHGYAATESVNTVATCDYGGSFSAIVQYQQYIGMQFHPEKSAAVGRKLLQNALNAYTGEQPC